MTAAAVAWAAERLGRPVVDVHRLLGGTTSTMLRLTDDAGVRTVLRLITEEPWRTHGHELASRESAVQTQLAGTGVIAPTTIALDASGEACGHPAHLMSHLPGATDVARVSKRDLDRVAAVLAGIHAVRGEPAPRLYQSWALEAKHVVPSWSSRPELWQRAFEVVRAVPPAYEPTFLHRDFALRNLLREGTEISGVVDWVETSTGPAWLDVAHCRTNLVIDHGSETGDIFAAAYARQTGRAPEPWWEVLDIVGFLPPPGAAAFTSDPRRLARLDEHLARTIDDLGR